MRRLTTSRKFPGAAFAVIVCLLAAPTFSAEIKATPSIALEGGWDSNIFNSSSNEQSDFIVRAIPGLAIYFDAFQTTAEFSGRLGFEWYADNKELEDNPSSITFRLSAAEPMRITARFSLSPYVGFLETQDSWTRTQLIPPPTPGIPDADQIVTGRTKTRDYTAGLIMNYLVSQRVDFTLGGGVARTDRLPDARGVELEDSRTIFADTSVAYIVNPQFKSGVYLNARYDTWDTSPDAQTYSGGLQGTYEHTQQYSFRGRAGVAYHQRDSDTAGETTGDWTPTASVSMNYTERYFSATLAASTAPSGGTGLGVITDRFTVYLSLTDQFAERWWWNLSGSYQWNKSVEEPATGGIKTMRGRAGISFNAREWISFRLQGDILRQRSETVGGDIDRETVSLAVDISQPFLF